MRMYGSLYMHICLSNAPLSLSPSHHHILFLSSFPHTIYLFLPLRLHKKDHELLEPLTSVEESDCKSSDQLKSFEKRMIVDQNNYLLAIEATNAHLGRHGDHDLPRLMEVRGKQLLVSHLCSLVILILRGGLGGTGSPCF